MCSLQNQCWWPEECHLCKGLAWFLSHSLARRAETTRIMFNHLLQPLLELSHSSKHMAATPGGGETNKILYKGPVRKPGTPASTSAAEQEFTVELCIRESLVCFWYRVRGQVYVHRPHAKFTLTGSGGRKGMGATWSEHYSWKEMPRVKTFVLKSWAKDFHPSHGAYL